MANMARDSVMDAAKKKTASETSWSGFPRQPMSSSAWMIAAYAKPPSSDEAPMVFWKRLSTVFSSSRCSASRSWLSLASSRSLSALSMAASAAGLGWCYY
eukprot:scaffold415_cov45-Phaeocystis_antarctica.AAC.1